MASRINLLLWHSVNMKLSKRKLRADKKLQNDFWIKWEKRKLLMKRMYDYPIRKIAKKRYVSQWRLKN